MTDRNNVEHLSVAMTTETVNDVIQTTSASVITSSSSRGIKFYFQCAVVVIGVVGTVANALILYAMVASKQHKKQILIFNQNVLDLFSCLFLIITNALKVCDLRFTGLIGYWFCMLILAESMLWSVIAASKVNLVFVTIERYLKVVYHVWSKKHLHNWVIYAAVVFAWISGIVHAYGIVFSTTMVIDDVCYPYMIWENRAAQITYAVFYFLSFYVFILVTFVFCYWRILVIIRRQAQVMAGYDTVGPSTSQVHSHQIESNVVKTMILVSAFHAITDLPINIHYMLINTNVPLIGSSYYALMFISFFYFCANPFIYAIKFDPVKNALLRLIPCKNTDVQPINGIHTVAPGSTPRGQISTSHK